LAVGDSIEISTQAGSDKQLDATTQTDEIVPEEKDAADISTQTDEACRMDSVVSDMTTQTESEPKSDTGVQTEEIEAKEEELKLDVAVQTEKSDESKYTAALTEISTQTDGAYENKMPKTEAVEMTTQTDLEPTPRCQETATQTDGLPQTIAVTRKDSMDESCTESYGETDLNDLPEEPFLQTSKGAPMDASDDHVVESSASLGDHWRPPKPSGSFNKSQAKNTSSDDERSLAALSNSSMSSLKEIFSKGSTAPTPEEQSGGSGTIKLGPSTPASPEDRMSRSASHLHYSPSQKDKGSVPGIDVRSKGRKKGDDHANTSPRNRPVSPLKPPTPRPGNTVVSPSKPPTPRLGNTVVSPSKWKSSPYGEAKSKLGHSPEWMSKLKEMGIKVDADDSEPKAEVEQKRRHSVAVAAAAEQANATADWIQKAKKFSKLEDDASLAAETPKVPPIVAPPSGGPEWMQKFKQLGIKGDEESIETAGTKQVAPEAVATEAHSDGAPEWMKKFRKIGHGEKAGSEMLQGGKPAGYEPRRFVDKFGAAITSTVTHEEDEEERKKSKKWKK
jgi:hypothetical protein